VTATSMLPHIDREYDNAYVQAEACTQQYVNEKIHTVVSYGYAYGTAKVDFKNRLPICKCKLGNRSTKQFQ